MWLDDLDVDGDDELVDGDDVDMPLPPAPLPLVPLVPLAPSLVPALLTPRSIILLLLVEVADVEVFSKLTSTVL